MEAENKEKTHWRKTVEGKWAICGQADEIQPGVEVEVFRKNGTSSLHRLSDDEGRFGRPFRSYESGEMLRFAYQFKEIEKSTL